MREIKFRAWDKYDKRMVEVDSIHLPLGKSSGKDITTYNKEEGYYEWVYDYELMQYTGLKDINQKEIYEGDILKSVAGKLLEVKISSKYGVYANVDFRTIELIGQSCPERNYKVIGNIYENSNLLY